MSKKPAAWAIIKAFFITWAFIRITLLTPGNIMSGIIFVLALCFIMWADKSCIPGCPGRFKKVAVILSLVYTLIYIAVDYVSITTGLTSGVFRLFITSVTALGMTLMLYYVILAGFRFLSGVKLTYYSKENADLPENESRNDKSKNFRKRFYVNNTLLSTFIICFICYLPYFLYLFPGVMTPDSIVQLEQTAGSEPLSNHHPLVHTLLMGFFFKIGRYLTHNDTLAAVFYTTVQMLFMILCAVFSVSTLKRLRIKGSYILAATLFYALIPYNAVFSVTIWKDVPFAGIVLVFVCSMLRLSLDIKDVGTNKKTLVTDIVTLVISGTGLCLFRSNGWYAFVVFALIYALCMLIRTLKQRKEFSGKTASNETESGFIKVMSTSLAIILILSAMIKYPLMSAFKIPQADFVESLSIPVQQIAAVITYNGDIAPQDMEELQKVIDIKYVRELYEPTFADNIKELVRAGHPEYLEANKGKFLGIWLRTFVKNPVAYYRAYMEQTVGYYFPDEFYNIANTEGVSGTMLDIRHTPLLGGQKVIKLKEIAIKLGNMLPVYSLLWSMGVIFWLLLFFAGYTVVEGRKERLLYYMPYLLLFVTVLLATPVATEFRYVYFMVYSLPLFPVIALFDNAKTVDIIQEGK